MYKTDSSVYSTETIAAIYFVIKKKHTRQIFYTIQRIPDTIYDVVN